MPSSRFGEERDYGFADQALVVRQRAGLTQRELAALLGVSDKAIRRWEAGLSYPAVEHLEQLIALALERGALPVGREEDEAARLWETVRTRAPRRTPPFDPHWFAALPPAAHAGLLDVPSPPRPSAAPEGGRHDWGEAPDVPALHDRRQEMAMLARWVDDERGRVVVVLGAGGIGKTALVARLAQERAPAFPIVYWRSLRNALPVEEWLAGAITSLSAAHIVPPEGREARLALVLELLRTQRALLVLDNLETVLEPEEPMVRYRPGYEGYGEVLQRLSASAHQGSIVLTSREQPLRADHAAVRSLHLGGLGVEDGRALLGRRNLVGDAASWKSLVERYGGNPLALGVVGETVAVVFGGDIAAFLAQEATVFGGIRQLLDEQITRLSPLEYAILLWLAVEREPVGFGMLVADLGSGVARGDAMEAVEALGRRSLLEHGSHGTFTLQPVVLEYATARLADRVCREVVADKPALLVSHALIKAQAKDYVRRSQERLIAQPLLAQLRAHLGGLEVVERRLPELLEAWRGRSVEDQGYGPGNVVNLLRLLRGDLRGMDLSGLALRQVYLQGVEAQDTSLAGAHVVESVLGEAFVYPTAVALSADGTFLAAGTSTGEVHLWWAADRTLLLALQGHSGGVWSVAISENERLLASGGDDGTVQLWELESGRLLATLSRHIGVVYGVAVSEDGRLVASFGVDGAVQLWEVTQEVPGGRPLLTIQEHAGGVRSVALSADGQLLASGGADGIVRLWGAVDWRPLAALEGHGGPVAALALSSDGRLVAAGSENGTVRLWEVHSGKLRATLEGHTDLVWGVALSGDGQLVASSSMDGTVRLWEVTQGVPGGRPLRTLEGHTGVVWGVALSRDGRLLGSGSWDGTVRLWEAHSGQLLATLEGQRGLVRGVALSRDGRWVASGSVDGKIQLWEVTQGVPGRRSPRTLTGHTGLVRRVALSGGGQILASASVDGTVKLWEVSGGQLLATLEGHTGVVYGVALSGDGRLVASGSADGAVKLWDAGSRRPLRTLPGHTGGVRGVALSADGQLLASGSEDGTVRLWKVESGQPLATLEGHTSGVYGVALSEDGRLVASGSWDGTVRLWSGEDGRPLRTLLGDTRLIRGVALSGDGRLLASGGDDGTVRLWEVESGASLAPLRSDRRFERLDITGLTGATEAQHAALRALGAIE
jgi:WD40 repeat protein/transcriptional regulator with XRE-family HTH domain